MFKQILWAFLLLAVAHGANENPTTTATPDTTSVKPVSPPKPEPTPDPKPTPTPTPSGPLVPTVSFQLEDVKKNIVAIGEFQGTLHLTLPDQKNPIDLALNNLTVLNVANSKSSDSKIVLSFNVNGTDANVLTFTLVKDNTSYSLSDITVQWTLPGDAKKNVSTVYTGDWNGTLFSVSADHSYLCLTQQSLKFNQDKKTNATIGFDVDNFKIDAFRSTNSTDFRTVSECEMDDKKRDFVPLAVGGSLIALVVIVLIAFLIGRKRSRRLAYESV